MGWIYHSEKGVVVSVDSLDDIHVMNYMVCIGSGSKNLEKGMLGSRVFLDHNIIINKSIEIKISISLSA